MGCCCLDHLGRLGCPDRLASAAAEGARPHRRTGCGGLCLSVDSSRGNSAFPRRRQAVVRWSDFPAQSGFPVRSVRPIRHPCDHDPVWQAIRGYGAADRTRVPRVPRVPLVPQVPLPLPWAPLVLPQVQLELGWNWFRFPRNSRNRNIMKIIPHPSSWQRRIHVARYKLDGISSIHSQGMIDAVNGRTRHSDSAGTRVRYATTLHCR